MTKRNGWTNYEERLSRVISYIHDHLEEPLDLDRLAEVACLSAFHWHRIYHAVYGETLARTVKRLRMHRAAARLALGGQEVEAIAKASGYSSLHAFTRAFKAVHGMPPAQYRREGNHAQFQSPRRRRSLREYPVEVRMVPKMQVAAVEHIGPYLEIGRAFDRLYGLLAARNLLGGGLRSFGLYYDDPVSVPEKKQRSRACAVVHVPAAVQPPLVPGEISGGPYAILRYVGPYSGMRAAYLWLYGSWLVDSGWEAADAPVVEEYLNNPRETPPGELITEICLPLRQPGQGGRN